MLQNRVDPLGRIIKTSARGSFMGNRGVIHNKHKEIIHTFKHMAWITCALEFKGRKRTVMTTGRWTELFSWMRPPPLLLVIDLVSNAGEKMQKNLSTIGYKEIPGIILACRRP